MSTTGGLARRFIEAVRTEGAGAALGRVGAALWSTRTAWFVLCCDLENPIELPSAELDVDMEEVDPAGFIGFKEEADVASVTDIRALEDRQKMCDAGLGRLYVSFTEAGDPVFTQWLITPERQDEMRSIFSRDLFPQLGPDEVLTEGAFTFSRYRRKGAMKRGKGQVLAVARSEGFRTAYATVEPDNLPSLRGNARVGFDLAYVGVVVRRFGSFRRRHAPARPEDIARWRAAAGAV